MNSDTKNKSNQQKLNLAKRKLIINLFTIMKCCKIDVRKMFNEVICVRNGNKITMFINFYFK